MTANEPHTVFDGNGIPRTGPNGCEYCGLGPGMHHPDAWSYGHPDRLTPKRDIAS